MAVARPDLTNKIDTVKRWISKHTELSVSEIDKILPGFCLQGLWAFGEILIGAYYIGRLDEVRESLATFVKETASYQHPEVCGNPTLNRSNGQTYTNLYEHLGLKDHLTVLPSDATEDQSNYHSRVIADTEENWLPDGFHECQTVSLDQLSSGSLVGIETSSGNRYLIEVTDAAIIECTLYPRYYRHPYSIVGVLEGCFMLKRHDNFKIEVSGRRFSFNLPNGEEVNISSPIKMWVRTS